ncbi:hydroxymethylglutaryl-CoA lyase [Amycolatopsis pithecellobii]|uniref:hydroxymethylglutaryl-CoA lyase n=1 Tax=Amycolatopsis pithecellobii TaxID=664692 RepID=UPI0028A61309|nr:hydroxymethylglutaryl-CoA lyase [Amycolatopsis pithecellobii]
MPLSGFPLSLPAAINLREVGPRDGLQIEKPIPTADKLRLLESLVAAGLRRIEATAFVSPRAVPAMADADQVAAELHRWPEIEWSALVANSRGADRAIDAGITNLEYVVSAADGHSQANAGRSTREATDAIPEIVAAVQKVGGQCEVIVATAWDCPFDGPTSPARVHEVVGHAHESGVDRVCLADTIGTATPTRIVELVESVRERVASTPIGLHMHNTRGAGLAGILAAMQVGIVDIDASIGGLGGCPFAPGASGNVATEELVYLCQDMAVETGVNLELLLRAATAAENAVGRTLPSNLLKAGDRARVPPPRPAGRLV